MNEMYSISAASECNEIARLRGYIESSLSRSGRTKDTVENLSASISKQQLNGGSSCPDRLMLVAHGENSFLVQKGSPKSGNYTLLQPSWWQGPWIFNICFLLGCFTIDSIPTYGLLQNAAGVIGYSEHVLFYDGNRLGRRITQMVVDAIIGAYLGGHDLNSVFNNLRNGYLDVAQKCVGCSWLGFLKKRRAVIRLMHLAIGLQLDGLQKERP